MWLLWGVCIVAPREACMVAPGGMHGCSRGACMVAPGGCVVAPGQGMHGCCQGVGLAWDTTR